MKLVISIYKKHAYALLILVTIIASAGFVVAITATQAYHPLQDVAKSASDLTSVDSNSNGIIDAAELLLGTNMLPASGSAGIGTTSPAQKLHVIGKAQADDFCLNADTAKCMAMSTCGGDKLRRATTFDAPNTYTFTVPACVYQLNIQLWGGGGDNGGCVIGSLAVSSLINENWIHQGTLHYDYRFETKSIGLNLNSDQKRELKIRITHSGDNIDAAHIDFLALKVGDKKIAPEQAIDLSNNNDILYKISRLDNDVVDVRLHVIEATWRNVNEDNVLLLLNAREEDLETLPGVPFQFPRSLNLDDESTFIEFELKNDGKMTVDGKIDESDSLGRPDLVSYDVPVTGHPPGYTYFYIENDGNFIYVTEDITADNTLDKEDWSKIYLYTKEGLKEFTVDASNQQYGKGGFVYTKNVGYQHKVYEFKIPVSEIKGEHALKIGFIFYGTEAAGGGDTGIGDPGPTGDPGGDPGGPAGPTGPTASDDSVQAPGSPDYDTRTLPCIPGGGGGYGRHFLAVKPGEAYTITVGAAGNGPLDGGTSSISKDGKTLVWATGGGSNYYGAIYTAGGISNALINFPGASGSMGGSGGGYEGGKNGQPPGGSSAPGRVIIWWES